MEEIKVSESVIDWDHISQYKLPNSFIDKYANKLNWKRLSKRKVSLDFLRRYKDYVDWKYASVYIKLPEKFIIEHSEYVKWDLISEYQRLSEEFIRTYVNRVNWIRISSYQELSEDFIEEYHDKVNWKMISYYQKLSESFIRKHIDKIDFQGISYRQELSENFIREFCDKLDWKHICLKQKFSFNFALEFKDYLTSSVFSTQDYSAKEKEYLSAYVENCSYVSLHARINKSFNTNYSDMSEFYNDLIKNYPINPKQFDAIIDKYSNSLSWWFISTREHLPKSFIKKYADKISWSHYLSMLRTNEIDREFLIQFIDKKIVFDFLLKKKMISFDNLVIVKKEN